MVEHFGVAAQSGPADSVNCEIETYLCGRDGFDRNGISRKRLVFFSKFIVLDQKPEDSLLMVGSGAKSEAA